MRPFALLITAWILTNDKIKIVLSQPASQPQAQYAVEDTTRVLPLVEGMMYPTEKGYVMVSSVTLILDQGYAIVVDSPSASDKQTTEMMLKALSNFGISPAQVHVALTSHGHPDHFGQQNLFTNARHLFGPYDYVNSVFNRNELFSQNEMQLTRNVQVWNTPGHTNQDVSVIVRNVPQLGTIGVVGDLFYSELDALSGGEDWSRDAWNAALGLENRRRILCTCDVIVPGHSRMFKVTPEMRSRVGCSLDGSVPPGQILSSQIPQNSIVPTQIPQQLGNQISPSQQIPTQTPNQISSQIPSQLPNQISSQMPMIPQSQIPNQGLQLPTGQPGIPGQFPTSQPANPGQFQSTGPNQMLPNIHEQYPQIPANSVYPSNLPPLQNPTSQSVRYKESEDRIQPSVISLPQEALRQNDFVGQKATQPEQDIKQTVLLPVLESAASHLANYLTAAQPGGPVPIPQHTATEVRTLPYQKKMTKH
ncbi:unnamed protein product [Bursaphelenchus okinawaensis]|uniref:Metallo-beta-lactamase domain-containing protein n=1 Tax=Bursaphelenchus okinawaensis TaxID=465554 RepID=A0A811LMM5_9BILA|nr:unnamed protein product [Bursaphelenchus okinawaensis]CAG9126411.1 unnamed protein product [Bursaphelenchus okinawaensis]